MKLRNFEIMGDLYLLRAMYLEVAIYNQLYFDKISRSKDSKSFFTEQSD